MRISTSISLKGDKGSQNFIRRLFKSLQTNFDVQIVGSNEKSDIHLSVSGDHRKSGALNIVRIDGVYYDKKRLILNMPIKQVILKSDGVIYQSKWSKVFAEKMLKVSNPVSTVIWNGAEPTQNTNIKINRRGFDKIFVSCALWRPNKRPEAIIEAFDLARKKSGLNLGLFMVGDLKYKKEIPGLVLLGKIHPEQINSIYKSSDYCIHICHLESCPNAVIESLVCGLPVLCNNIGGTPEVVGESGIVLSIDKKYNFKVINSMQDVGSQIVNIELLSNGILDMCNRQWKVDRPDLSIDVSAKQYYDFFKLIRK